MKELSNQGRRRLRVLSLLCLLPLALSACQSSESGGTTDVNSSLQPAPTTAAFIATMKDGLRSMARRSPQDQSNNQPQAPSGINEDVTQNRDNFSTTNLIEAGVDEADVIKFDGTWLYTVEQPSWIWGWMEPLITVTDQDGTTDFNAGQGDAPDGLVQPPLEPEPAIIHVYRTTQQPPGAAPEFTIPLGERGLTVDGLYLLPSATDADRDTLAVVAGSGHQGWIAWDQPQLWQGGKTTVLVYAIAAEAAGDERVQEVTRLAWQGYPLGSRRIGNRLYVVSRHMPTLQDFVPYPFEPAQEAANMALIDAAGPADLLPQLMVDASAAQSLVSGEDCYINDVAPDAQSPYILTVTMIDLNEPANPHSVCTNGADAGLYVSLKSLYLTELRYEGNDGRYTTRIHKFAFAGEGLDYRGAGEVAGTLGWNQPAFRLSDAGEHLRVVSTDYSAAGNPAHRLTVLTDRGAGRLERLAELPNDRHPEAIGKEREDLYGVRFLGDRAYLVTFERIDPLYVVDLSEAADPQLVGQLEVPGVSDYLQLLDEDTLFAIGRLDDRVQLSLFDVSQPQAPVLADQLVAGDSYNWTVAGHDHHALAWVQDDATTFRLALPLSTHLIGQQAQGLQKVSVDLANRRLQDVGLFNAVPPGLLEPHHYGTERAVIDGEAIHYVNGHQVWSALWD